MIEFIALPLLLSIPAGLALLAFAFADRWDRNPRRSVLQTALLLIVMVAVVGYVAYWLLVAVT